MTYVIILILHSIVSLLQVSESNQVGILTEYTFSEHSVSDNSTLNSFLTRDTTQRQELHEYDSIQPITSESAAGDEYWTLPTVFPGINGTVTAILVDGNDIYISGLFSEAGNLEVNNIVRYNTVARTWQALGSGLVNGGAQVMLIHEGYLYVGGTFNQVGGNAGHMGRYNLTTKQWEAFGLANNNVNDIVIYNQKMYVFGAFGNIGGIEAARMAIYDFGTQTWSSPYGANGVIFSVDLLGDVIYVGGDFTSIGGIAANRVASYSISTATWAALGDGANNTIERVYVYNNEVFILGLFNEIDGVSASRIARYNPALSTFSGLSAGLSSRAIAMVAYGDYLYIGGNITSAGGVSVSGIARYHLADGIWERMIGDFTNPFDAGFAIFDFGSTVTTIVVKEGQLIVGGDFKTADNVSVNNLASLNPTTRTYSQFIQGGAFDGASINTVKPDNSHIYVGGNFTNFGGIELNGIARYNIENGSWEPLGSGVNGSVNDIAIYFNNVYAVGSFSEAGGVHVTNIARFDLENQTWHSTGADIDGTVHAVAAIFDRLYVGVSTGSGAGLWKFDGNWERVYDSGNVTTIQLAGNFIFTGGDLVGRYNLLTDTFEAFAGSPDQVRGLQVAGDYVYVVGNFTESGGNPVNGVSRYHINTGNWEALGTGITPIGGSGDGVETVLVVGDQVYVGGKFTTAGSTAASAIARYSVTDGVWHALGSGVSEGIVQGFNTLPVQVKALGFSGEELYVGGSFGKSGGINSRLITRWSGPELDGLQTYVLNINGPHQGWRMMGSPVPNTTYGTLLNGIWTQGFSGASASHGAPNVYWYNEATRTFEAPTDATNIVGSSTSSAAFNSAARGFIVYIFEDDFYDGTSTSWPKSLQVKGNAFDGQITVTYPQTDNPDDNLQGWHIASNPYTEPINWYDLVADNALNEMLTVTFIYDANANAGAGGYRLNYGFPVPNLPETIAFDGVIPPFQGFWVRTTGNAPSGSITFKTSHQTTGGTFYRQSPQSPDYISLLVDGDSGLQAATMLTLNHGETDWSTSMPAALHTEPIRFGFMESENVGLAAVINREFGSGDQLSMPLYFEAVESGTYTLSVTLPDGISLKLVDNHTGTTRSLNAETAYTFDYQTPGTQADKRQPEELLPLYATHQTSGEPRFEVRIENTISTNVDRDPILPAAFTLQQNYPNPFNPTTTIRYGLPEVSDVAITIYNMLGQPVAKFSEGSKQPGWHEVRFDGSQLASGKYLVRLQAGSHMQTMSMTLIK